MMKRSISAACLAVIALAVVMLLTQEETGNQRVLEEMDPDVPVNLQATVSSIEPHSGPFTGDNEVVITGANMLSGGAADIHKVVVGGVESRIISASPNKIHLVLGHRSARIHNPGPADVAIVSRTMGQTVAHNLYSFNVPPRIIGVRPDNGPHEGGNEVVVRGRHLSAGKHDKVSVFIDGEKCKVLEQSRHHMRVLAAPRQHHSRRHTAHVVVKSAAYGKSKLRRSYTYNPAPAITHVSPVEGPSRGGNLLQIHGDMITSGGRVHEKVSVKVGGKNAEVVSFSPNSVLVKAPKQTQAGLVDIEVLSSLHGRSSKPMAYKYNSHPTITAVKPSKGQADGGDHIVIRGEHLGKGDVHHVYFGSRRGRVLRAAADGTEILVQTRRFSEDEEGTTVPVKLVSTAFGAVHSKGGFKVGKRGKILSISPQDGPCSGGTHVTITGQNLAEGNEAAGEIKATVASAPAKVVSQSAKQVVVKTSQCRLGSAKDVVTLFSPTAGNMRTPYSVKFQYNSLPRVQHITPGVGSFDGGTELLLKGERLCSGTCADLESIRVGNAVIRTFKIKSPRRIVFTAPSAQVAGGVGEKTVVIHSKRFGRTVVPQGFTINDSGAKGTVHPNNVPLQGGSTVTIEAPGLNIAGQASTFGVELAGVPARVVSVSSNRLVLTAGDATTFPQWRKEMAAQGLAGNVVVTATVGGKTFAKDLGLNFRYNPACNIEAVTSRPGAHAGEMTMLISGSNLGFSDESIMVDNVWAKVHRRERHGSNVFRHYVTVPHMAGDISLVEVKSRRSGHCVWHPLSSPTSTKM
jgi:hypothetical protein